MKIKKVLASIVSVVLMSTILASCGDVKNSRESNSSNTNSSNSSASYTKDKSSSESENVSSSENTGNADLALSDKEVKQVEDICNKATNSGNIYKVLDKNYGSTDYISNGWFREWDSYAENVDASKNNYCEYPIIFIDDPEKYDGFVFYDWKTDIGTKDIVVNEKECKESSIYGFRLPHIMNLLDDEKAKVKPDKPNEWLENIKCNIESNIFSQHGFDAFHVIKSSKELQNNEAKSLYHEDYAGINVIEQTVEEVNGYNFVKFKAYIPAAKNIAVKSEKFIVQGYFTILDSGYKDSSKEENSLVEPCAFGQIYVYPDGVWYEKYINNWVEHGMKTENLLKSYSKTW